MSGRMEREGTGEDLLRRFVSVCPAEWDAQFFKATTTYPEYIEFQCGAEIQLTSDKVSAEAIVLLLDELEKMGWEPRLGPGGHVTVEGNLYPEVGKLCPAILGEGFWHCYGKTRIEAVVRAYIEAMGAKQ